MKKLVVLGAGESGVGAAVLGKQKGFEVFVSDFGEIKSNFAEQLTHNQIEFEQGGHTNEHILNADVVVKSPGIPDKAPIVKAIRDKGIELISEIEFASRFTDAKIIAITGSNGKTTTTNLIYHILKNADLNVAMVGNVGKSFAAAVAEQNASVYVVEVSSFQLDDIVSFQPNIAVLTNITPDHLDRYNYEFANYIQSKFKIIENQTEQDAFVYNADDEVIASIVADVDFPSQHYSFSLTKPVEQGAYSDGEYAYFTINQNQYSMSIYQFALKGKHNASNSMAAGIVAELMGIRKDLIRQSLQDFDSLEHRMEQVAFVKGIEFINDSKATNVNSTWFALESMTKPVVWIVGGVDKGNDYESLLPLVKGKVKAIICLGKDNEKIKSAFADVVETIEETQLMTSAVRMAYYLGEKDDAVLLSPACASFDLFNNYEDRGNQFKQAVREL